MLKIIVLVIAVVIAGCRNIPSDPGKTFQKISETGIIIGYSVNPPWTTDDSNSAGGTEGYIIKEFAKENNINIEWQNGSEQELLRRLEEKEIHIVISGIRKDTPWKKKKIGLTTPYYKDGKDKRVIAVKQGENRLIMNLEKFYYSHKDSIIAIVNATKQDI